MHHAARNSLAAHTATVTIELRAECDLVADADLAVGQDIGAEARPVDEGTQEGPPGHALQVGTWLAQALAVPVGLLTGITPLEAAPHTWFVQVLWIAGMWLLSMLFFRVAVRKVTVQGG